VAHITWLWIVVRTERTGESSFAGFRQRLASLSTRSERELTEVLDLTTPTGRAMADLLTVFAEFMREILRERIRASAGGALRRD